MPYTGTITALKWLRTTYHLCGLHSGYHPLQVGDDLPRVVVGNEGGVPGPDPLAPVDEHHGQDGAVPLRLDAEVVLVESVELVVVWLGEGQPSQGLSIVKMYLRVYSVALEN